MPQPVDKNSSVPRRLRYGQSGSSTSRLAPGRAQHMREIPERAELCGSIASLLVDALLDHADLVSGVA
jgi:hypothetical protein